MKVKSESEAPQSCPTLRDPMDCSPPGSSVHGILQARVLEWGAIAFSNQFPSSYQKAQEADLEGGRYENLCLDYRLVGHRLKNLDTIGLCGQQSSIIINH